ncbi:MAG: translation elongation factor EF1A family protein, partial [Phycisphaerales bacterium]|nr:translation elongation factor EF1A family protein [Phycisphaerales bacterium]
MKMNGKEGCASVFIQINRKSTGIPFYFLVEAMKNVEAIKIKNKSNEKKRAMAASDVPAGLDPRPHLNLVFMGHVDHGKSTLCGRILYASGEVDQRMVEKYEKEAKEKNRGSWWLAYIFDTNEEERAKGKTVEVGRAPFATQNRRFTILDAPGHKNYVPNMIAGAAQADVGVLVISAKRGEFESGFEKAGQTREHAMLAKTLGVSRLVVAVNKMDDESVQWSEERFTAIKDKLFPFLRNLKYPMKKGVDWIPISALGGGNITDPIGDACPWYTGPPFLTLLDSLTIGSRDAQGSLRVPILDKFKDRGLTTCLGKIESGSIKTGDRLVIMPNRQECVVGSLGLDTGDVEAAICGENIQIRLKNVETADITAGMVICNPESLCSCASSILVQLCIMEIKSVFSAGYTAVMHIHTCTVEVEVDRILALYEKNGKDIQKKRPTYVPQNSLVAVVLKLQRPVCLELFSEYQQLGR